MLQTRGRAWPGHPRLLPLDGALGEDVGGRNKSGHGGQVVGSGRWAGTTTDRGDFAADSLRMAWRAIIDSIHDCGRRAGQGASRGYVCINCTGYPCSLDRFPSLCRAVRGTSRGGEGRRSRPQNRLGRTWPVGLQPTDFDPGHPRLGAVATKSWIRGSSPRKTAENRLLRVQQDHRARKLSTDSPASLRGAAGDEAISMVWACEVPEIASLRSQ